MSAIFNLKKGSPKKTKIFHFLKGRYFVLGGSIGTIVGVL